MSSRKWIQVIFEWAEFLNGFNVSALIFLLSCSLCQRGSEHAPAGSITTDRSHISVCRSALHSLWLVVTWWWRPEGREWEGDCTPGELLRVCYIINLWAQCHRWEYELSYVCLCPVENQSHCDFVKLRNMLIRSHMHDLKDVTCDVHYENYRAQCIQEMTRYVSVVRMFVWIFPHFTFPPFLYPLLQ